MLRNSVQEIEAARPPRIVISFRGAAAGPFASDDGRYYLRADRIDSAIIEYVITGIGRELKLDVRDGEITRVRYAVANFTRLSQASQRGIQANLFIEVTEGPDAGFEELLDLILPHIGPQVADDYTTEEVSDHILDVPRYWQKLLELEASLQPKSRSCKRSDRASVKRRSMPMKDKGRISTSTLARPSKSGC